LVVPSRDPGDREAQWHADQGDSRGVECRMIQERSEILVAELAADDASQRAGRELGKVVRMPKHAFGIPPVCFPLPLGQARKGAKPQPRLERLGIMRKRCHRNGLTDSPALWLKFP
jgi:hypothetical protein